MLQIGDQEKIVIPMVGLPARGKSYFSKKITRFLHWLGYSCKIFNVGNYRRQKIGKINFFSLLSIDIFLFFFQKNPTFIKNFLQQ